MLCTAVSNVSKDICAGRDAMKEDLKKSGQMISALFYYEKDNDREINEWYNKNNQDDKL